MEKAKKHNKRIKKGDKVIVIAGNDRGHVGEVMSRTENRVVVKGANIRKKHMKKGQEAQQPGQIIDIECPIHLSNVKLYLDTEVPYKLRCLTEKTGEKKLLFVKEGKEELHRVMKKAKK